MRNASRPPGLPTPWPILGLQIQRNPIGFFSDAQRRYGDIFTLSVPYYGRVVVVTSPELIKSVFTADPAQ